MTKNFLKELMDVGPEHSTDEKGIIAAIEAGYLVGRGPREQKKKSFSPSSLAYGNGECPRYWYLAFDGQTFEDDADAYAVANMSSGTLSHERIQSAMEKSGILKEKERKLITTDPPIFGFVDAIIEWNGEEIPVEIKTARDESFTYRKQSRKPPTYHLIQVLLYMKILKKEKGLLMYENKNSHELLLIPVTVNDEYRAWMDKTFAWMRTVRKAWEDQTLPTKNYRSNSKVCKTCPIQKACADAGKGVVKIASMEKLK